MAGPAHWMWLLIGCVLLLAAGIYIKPDPRGHGTHEQLGFAPCGFYLMTGYACPTCGATTAFAWMVHGRPWMAIKTQPFGALTAVAASGFAWDEHSRYSHSRSARDTFVAAVIDRPGAGVYGAVPGLVAVQSAGDDGCR